MPGGDQPTQESQPLADVPFWRLVGHQAIDVAEEPEQFKLEEAPVTWSGRPKDAARFQPLASWRALLPRLRRAVAGQVESRAVDLDAVVRHVSQGRLLHRLPRKKRLQWGSRVHVVVDQSERLVPYWLDQELVCTRLARLFPRHGVVYTLFRDGLSQPMLTKRQMASPRPWRPAPGALVLVLGDLGCLATGSRGLSRAWDYLGRRLQEAGCRIVALTPCPTERWSPAPRSPWNAVAWERSTAPAPSERAALEQRAERLLRLVSPAVRVEPGLLRGVRHLLDPKEADAGTEADAWQHPAVISTHSVAATLDPTEAKRLRRAFRQEQTDLRRRVLTLLRLWRAKLPQEIWFEEIRSLDAESQALLPNRRDLDEAEWFFQQTSRQVQGGGDRPAPTGVWSWFHRLEHRLTDDAWADPQNPLGVEPHVVDRAPYGRHTSAAAP